MITYKATLFLEDNTIAQGVGTVETWDNDDLEREYMAYFAEAEMVLFAAVPANGRPGILFDQGELN